MDHAVQPLIFYPKDRREDPRFAEGAIRCLRMGREWYARELTGRTFRLGDPVTFRSQFTEHELQRRHRRNGESDHAEMWTGAIREAIHGGAITGGPDRIYYFVLVGRGSEQGWSWRRDYFGCAAYIAGEAAEVMAGLRRSVRHRDYFQGITAAAGLMAHELAHCFSSFGSKHLDNLDGPDGRWDNLLGMGYSLFPQCVLNDEQKESLLASPFLVDASTLLATWTA
jgi:hypothetical protein